MKRDLALRCTCGALQGELRDVRPSAGNHAVCYCRDCQSFAHFLGRAPEILDEHGGTDIFQMSPAKVHITQGIEHLASLRLSDRGLIRWYADCCKAPIGNTLATNKMPFVGIVLFCLAPEMQSDVSDKALGPVQLRGFRQFAKRNAGHIPPDRIPLAWGIARFLALMAIWKLRGDARRTPFFNAHDGQPTAVPRILTLDERNALREQVRASSCAA
jgi:hypothetical protein